MNRFSGMSSMSTSEEKLLQRVDGQIEVLLEKVKENGNNVAIAKEYLVECLLLIKIKTVRGISSLQKYIATDPMEIIASNCDIVHIQLIVFMYAYVMLTDPILDKLVSHLIFIDSDHPNTVLMSALLHFERHRFTECQTSFIKVLDLAQRKEMVITADVMNKINICFRINEEIDRKYSIVQLRAGVDLAINSTWYKPLVSLINTYASQLCNLIYIIVDLHTKKCFIVDPCWDVESILNKIHENKWILEGIITTHHHFDHVGGIPPSPFDKFYMKVPGVHTILETYPNIPIYIHVDEVNLLIKQPGNDKMGQNIKSVVDLDVISTSPSLHLQFIHTPGHTTGSLCIWVNESRLLTGDTLFCKSCGRTDFPESNIRDMCTSLKRLSEFKSNTIVLPGHSYNGRQTTIGDEIKDGLLKFAHNEHLLYTILTKPSASL